MNKNHVSNSRRDRDHRRMVAQDSQNGRELLDATMQLKELDRRLGKGVGAVKERARLEKMLTKKQRKVAGDGDNNHGPNR